MVIAVRPADARVPVGGETSVVNHGFWEDNGCATTLGVAGTVEEILGLAHGINCASASTPVRAPSELAASEHTYWA